MTNTPPKNGPDIGHNGGPPIEEPVDLFVRYAWTVAHRAVWKTPPMDILRFRVARAEAAGVTYREYMLELLDSGRHLQAEDRAAAPGKPRPKPSDTPMHGREVQGGQTKAAGLPKRSNPTNR